MILRLLLKLGLLGVCLAVAPTGPPTRTAPAAAAPLLSACEKLPTKEEFAQLAKTDPIAMLNASLSRYQCENRGYFGVLQKQERVKGSLGQVEIIRVAVRDDPFAVQMKWEKNAGLASATLYAKGENNGNLKARTVFGVQDSDPNGMMARQSSRFSIQDLGIYRGTLRTYNVWKAAQDRGTLKVEYLGLKPILECNNRLCHVLKRTCDPPEVDNFSMADTGTRSPKEFPKEAIGTATIMIDAETFLHVGSDIRMPDGSLLAGYYFRDLKMNPTFDREQFLPSILKK